MASFGVSIPDDLAAEIDAYTNQWRSNRSQTITRIFLEWKELRAVAESRLVRLLPGFIPNEAIEMMKVKPAVAGTARPEQDDLFHLGTGPGDELEEATAV